MENHNTLNSSQQGKNSQEYLESLAYEVHDISQVLLILRYDDDDAIKNSCLYMSQRLEKIFEELTEIRVAQKGDVA